LAEQNQPWTYEGGFQLGKSGNVPWGEVDSVDGEVYAIFQKVACIEQTLSGLDAGKRYTIFWSQRTRAQFPGFNNYATNDIKFSYGNGDGNIYYDEVKNTVDWEEKSGYFTAGDNDAILKICSTHPNGDDTDSTTFIDKIVITKYEDAPCDNLIKNGGFETFQEECNKVWCIVADRSIPHWTSSIGEVEIVNESYFFQQGVYEGSWCLDLNTITPYTIYQDMNTVEGTSYTLSFYLSKNTRGPSDGKMFVWIGETQYSTEDSFDITTGQYAEFTGTGDWIQYTLEYLATSETTFVAFGSLSPGNAGAALDAIELVAVSCVATGTVNQPVTSSGYSGQVGKRLALVAAALVVFIVVV
jgi:hypothetical protein